MFLSTWYGVVVSDAAFRAGGVGFNSHAIQIWHSIASDSPLAEPAKKERVASSHRENGGKDS